MKQRKRQIKHQRAPEVLEKNQKLAGLIKQADVICRQQERRRQDSQKPPNVLGSILIITVVWSLAGLDRYCKHHNDYWFLAVLSAILAAFGSGYLVYCLASKRTFTPNYSWRGFLWWGRGLWTYRDEDPFTYWLYVVFLLLFSGVMIYMFFCQLIYGSV